MISFASGFQRAIAPRRCDLTDRWGWREARGRSSARYEEGTVWMESCMDGYAGGFYAAVRVGQDAEGGSGGDCWDR